MEQELLNSGILIQYRQFICVSGYSSSGLLLLYPEESLTSTYSPSESSSFCTHFVSKDINGGAALATLDANPTEPKRNINQVFH